MEGDASSTTGGFSPDTLGWADLGFHKYEGLGNDFVVVEAERDDAVPVELAQRLCDRRLGVGADGVLLLLPPRAGAGADGRMVVINADGSIPEMCGNGLRCVALHLARRRGKRRGGLIFETGAGMRPCLIEDEDGRGLVTVEMGVVRFLEDVHLEVDGDGWDFALATAGNPHAITRRPASRADIERVGPQIEKHPHFPAGTNVEFVTVHSPTSLELVVWERGVGITQACGTGACATVAVAIAKGWSPADTTVAVRLPGGALFITIDARGNTKMTGPARHVYSGRLAPQFRTEEVAR